MRVRAIGIAVCVLVWVVTGGHVFFLPLLFIPLVFIPPRMFSFGRHRSRDGTEGR